MRLSVAAGAALGFRDVTVTTGGETARGIGALQVVEAPAAPAVVSVSPPVVAAGSTRDVTISGALTHFGAGSVADLGDGVTVNHAHRELADVGGGERDRRGRRGDRLPRRERADRRRERGRRVAAGGAAPRRRSRA